MIDTLSAIVLAIFEKNCAVDWISKKCLLESWQKVITAMKKIETRHVRIAAFHSKTYSLISQMSCVSVAYCLMCLSVTFL